MAYPKVKTTLGGGSESRDRWDGRAIVKDAARKVRRQEARDEERRALAEAASLIEEAHDTFEEWRLERDD